MGFLRQNSARSSRTVQKRPGVAKGSKPKRSKGERASVYQGSGIKLDCLPVEVLSMIFIYSGNPELAFCNSMISSKLSSSEWTKRRFLENVLIWKDEERYFPIQLCLRRLVTVETLKRLDITGFIDEKGKEKDVLVPELIFDRSYDLVKFMVGLNCNCSTTGLGHLMSAIINRDIIMVRFFYQDLGVAKNSLEPLKLALDNGFFEIADIFIKDAMGEWQKQEIWSHVMANENTNASTYLISEKQYLPPL